MSVGNVGTSEVAAPLLVVAEDDRVLREVLVRTLKEEGMRVLATATGQGALEFAEAVGPDLFVIDIGLPDSDGRDVCQALRARGIAAPVLFLTARDALPDRLGGFAAGGDDYVTKPFDLEELVARIRALLRRASTPQRLVTADLELDPTEFTISRGSVCERLTPTEFRLAGVLFTRAGRTTTREELVRAAWPAGAIVGLTVLTAAFNLVFSVTLNRDATALAGERASSLADLAASELASGERLRPETRAGVGQPGWIFANGRELVRPRAAPVDEQAARQLARSGRSTIKVSTTNVLLAAEPIRVGKRAVGRAVAVVSLDPYERVREETLVGSILFSLLLVAAITVAGRYLIAAALRPVARMTERAAEWSERDLERRFALGEPRDELTRLAATLDRLLDRLVQSLRREQRFSAELAHELRTPLAGMIAQAQLALRGQRDANSYRRALADVLESARRMSACLDALLTAERAETSLKHGRSELGECAAAVAESHRPLAARAGVDIEVEPAPERVLVAAEPELVERALSPLVENGCRYGRRRVRVIVRGGSEQATVAVVDDGDGVAPDEVEAVFEPGRRGSQADTDHGGAGLGLALARRLARAAGGDVVARPGPPGRFELRLPRA